MIVRAYEVDWSEEAKKTLKWPGARSGGVGAHDPKHDCAKAGIACRPCACRNWFARSPTYVFFDKHGWAHTKDRCGPVASQMPKPDGAKRWNRIGWKKVLAPPFTGREHYLVKLEIPEEALVRYYDGDMAGSYVKHAWEIIDGVSRGKMRAQYAKVLRIEHVSARKAKRRVPSKQRIGISEYERGFAYVEGQLMEPREKFNETPGVECGSGIHFFASRDKAADYAL